jgi:hypothetical protein
LDPIYKKSLIYVANAAVKKLTYKIFDSNSGNNPAFRPLISPHTSPTKVDFYIQLHGLRQPSPGPEFHPEFIETRSNFGQKIFKQT